MATADIVALTVIGLAALWGLLGGFWAILLGFAAWSGAVWVALHGAPLIEPFIAPHVPQATVAVGLSLAVSFTVAILVFSMIARALAAVVRGSVLGGVDRLLGMALGAALGFGVLVVGFVVMSVFFGADTMTQLHGSRLAPYIGAAATHLEDILPGATRAGLAPFRAAGHDAAI